MSHFGPLWWRIVPAFAAGYFISYSLRTVNAVIAPELTREFSASAADLGLLTSAYFLAFGAFQLPLGVLLDRYGPRRVEAVLLCIAGLGCVLFGLAQGIPGLVIGRALIGLGVSACLMASFKAFSQWFPTEQIPGLTGAIMVSGGLGALVTSVPVEMALPSIGWRGVFYLFAGLNFIVATYLWFSVPDKDNAHPEPLAHQLHALARIFATADYWRFAPQGAFILGGFMAIQSLWAVPWMMTIDGFDRGAAAHVLFLMGVAMLCGFLFVATAVVPLSRRGVSPLRLLQVSQCVALLAEVAILLDLAPPEILWPLLGGCFSLANLGYSQLAVRYPVALSGRVNTAFNLLVFAGAFGLQWGFGGMIDAFGAQGMSRAEAFRAAFGALLAVQILTWLWFIRPKHKAVA